MFEINVDIYQRNFHQQCRIYVTWTVEIFETNWPEIYMNLGLINKRKKISKIIVGIKKK